MMATRRDHSMKSEEIALSVMSTFSEDDFEENGLGERYFYKMNQRKETLHQVDAQTGFIETCGSVRSSAIQVAAELKLRKVKTTDIIVVCSRQHAEQTVAILGILFAGAIVAPIDPDVAHDECTVFLARMAPKFIFCDSRAVGQMGRVIAEQGRTRHCQIVVFGNADPDRCFKNFMRKAPDPHFKPTKIMNPARSVAFILQTQGTQDFPKMVCVSHLAIYRQIQNMFRICSNVKTTISYITLTSIRQTTLVCLSFEAPIVRVLPGEFTEKIFCSNVHDLRIDHAFLTAEYAKMISVHPAMQDYDISCLKSILIGGVRLSALAMSRIRAGIPMVKVIQTYCLVEVGLVAAFEEENYSPALERPMSVGGLLPGVKVKILDLETRKALGPNCRGELVVKGDSLMLGYLKDPETTLASMDKGYFKTMDLAEYDEDGYVYMEGTLSELITINGRKTAPLEIEEVILSHPIVKEIAVISDGNEMVACVIREPDAEGKPEDNVQNIEDFIKDNLPADKRPHRVVLFEFFQKTSGGKIKRHELRSAIFRRRFRKAESIGTV